MSPHVTSPESDTAAIGEPHRHTSRASRTRWTALAAVALTTVAGGAACVVADPKPAPLANSSATLTVPARPAATSTPPGSTPAATSTPAGTNRVDPAIAARGEVTFLVECLDDNLVKRPKTFALSCADGNQSLEGLSWSGWGATKATASGRVRLNTCEPDCARGKDVTYPVRVTASRLVEGETSATYRVLTVVATGARPKDVPATEVFNLPGHTPGQGPEVMVP